MHDPRAPGTDPAHAHVPDIADGPGRQGDLPPTLTVWQAARLLRIGRSTAHEAIRDGTWPTRVIRVGRCIRIPTADVLALLHGLSNSPE